MAQNKTPTSTKAPVPARATTETETVVATIDLTVEPGDQGLKGPTGPVGAAGVRGDQGPKGPVGQAGIAGDQGVKGPVGAAGPVDLAGERGPKGATGPVGPVADNPELGVGQLPGKLAEAGNEAVEALAALVEAPAKAHPEGVVGHRPGLKPAGFALVAVGKQAGFELGLQGLHALHLALPQAVHHGSIAKHKMLAAAQVQAFQQAVFA